LRISSLIVEKRPRILVVDDEPYIRDVIADFLTMEGFEVRTAADGQFAEQELARSPFDVVLTDLKMPNVAGLDLLRLVTQAYPSTLTVIMTGFGTVETAIDAMKQGAYDYVLKPFKTDEIIQVIRRALAQKRLKAENLRLREAVSLYKVSEAISQSLSLDEVIETVTRATIEDAHADLVLVCLDDGRGHYVERTRCCASPTTPGDIRFLPESAHSTLPSTRARLCTSAELRELLEGQDVERVSSGVLCPLCTRDRQFGWVLALSLSESRVFDEGQRKLMQMVTSRAAAAIDNARLYSDLQATFYQTIESLARTLDKMDHYTAGHSERVARYAVRLARALGLNEALIEVTRQAALMHDIGKIGCIMNLNKPSKLTRDEYEVFKQHPANGKDILEPIQFLEPVVPGVYCHHERWDGNGYPRGLAGKNIPLIARIISIADAYDAMTSDRAYRRALPHEVTVDEICRCAGTQFDPDIAGTFQEEIDTWLEEWRAEGITVPD
jgi:response regulator RpfG family c-di-GMP phosphodiesterase